MMPNDRNTRHLLTPRPYPARLSLVAPMYNEEAMVDSLREAVERFAAGVRGHLEIVLVNDGSSDGTLDKIATWAHQDSRVKVVHLSRNFGHHLAATAGLDYASGDAVGVLR